ncbi:hypothetical protein OAK45_00315 [Verrucomicrobia bacterium]|nr:hypothetical protein [Verrucomicrobiota bacterium]
MNRYLLPSSPFRILFCSLICLATVLLRSSGEAAETHRIILIDTSSTMRWKQNINAIPNKTLRERSRIDAIKKPLKAYIKTKAKAGDTLRIYTFAKPVELQQEEEKGIIGIAKNVFKNQNTLVLTFSKAKLEDDLEEADDFVDKMDLIVGTGRSRPTHLYESMDKILGLATGLIKDGKKVSVLIISDGVDSSEGKPFKDMGAVMKNHNATIKNLSGKVFCKIVKFNLSDSDKTALEKAKIGIKDARNLEDEEVFEPKPEPKIAIKAAFEVQLNEKAVKERDVIWVNEKPLVFTLTDKTIAKKMDKLLEADQKDENLNYAWSFNEKTKNKPDKNQGPIDVRLGPGDHEINLTVNEITKGGLEDSAETLNFTIKKVAVNAAIVKANAEKRRAVQQGEAVDFKFDFFGPEGAEIEWHYGDGEKEKGKKGEGKKHIYQVPSPPGAPYEVVVEITLPNEEVIKKPLGSVQVAMLNARAVAKPNNPWPGEEVTFTTSAKNVDSVIWNVDGVEMEPNDLNFALTHTFEMEGKVRVFAMVKQKGIDKPLLADANIVVKDVLPKIVVDNANLFVGEETKYTVTQANNGQPFPPGFKVEVDLPEGGEEKPAEIIFFTKAAKKHEVKAKITPKGSKKTFLSEDAAILIVKDIKINIDVEKAKE